MADRVQFILDKMAPLFRSLEELEIFTMDEIKSIIKQRTDYEYLLRRRQLTPSDYYKYLKFELNLEELRSIRCYSLTQNHSNNRELQQQYRKIQSLFIKHICYIFDRAVRRFSDHMELWNDYITFLKEKKCYNILNTIYAKVLNLYPTNEFLWLQASVYELNVNSNAHAARILLQRGLRFNKLSKKLWLRYFELELWYSLRYQERRNYLGLDDKEIPEVETEAQEEDPSLGIPWIVYQHAMTAITENNNEINDNQQFCLLFLNSCEGLSSSLHQRIYCDIERRYGHTTQYWINLLQQYIDSTSLESNYNYLDDYDVQTLLRKRNIDEADDGETLTATATTPAATPIDAITRYLESCYQILSNYQIFQKSNKSYQERNQSHLYGRILVKAFRRVMNQMSMITSEFYPQQPSVPPHTTTLPVEETIPTNKKSNKRKKKNSSSIEDPSPSVGNGTAPPQQHAIEQLIQIFEKFRVLLITIRTSYPPTDYQANSEIMISQHELYRCLNFLSITTKQKQTINTEDLCDIPDLIHWITNTSSQLSNNSSISREFSVSAWFILEVLWNSAYSSFQNLDLLSESQFHSNDHHQHSTQQQQQELEQPSVRKCLDEMKSVVSCLRNHMNLILLSSTNNDEEHHHHPNLMKNIQKFFQEFFYFLQNPSPLLSEYYRPFSSSSSSSSNLLLSSSSIDLDDETDDEDSTSMEYFPTYVELLQQLISFPLSYSSNQRCQWCLDLVRYVATYEGTNEGKYHQTLEWIDQIFTHLSQYMTSSEDAFLQYYQEVIQMEFHFVQSTQIGSVGRGTGTSNQFLEKLCQQAIQRCPSSRGRFEELRGDLERMKGNHQLANHYLWRKKMNL